MSASSLFAGVAIAAASLFGSTAAVADTISLDPFSTGVLAGSFRHLADGLFIDTYDFTPTTFTGVVSVTLTSFSGPVAFFTATLNGDDFSYFPELGDPDFSFQSHVTADMPLTLTVFGSVLDADGNSGGSGMYGGSVSATEITAVPEAQTWTLLLAGLGVTGLASARRRRSGDHTAAVAA